MDSSNLRSEDYEHATAHRVIFALTVICLVPIVTYVWSLLRGALALRDTKGKIPPTVPFFFPLIAHVPEFLWNIERFFDKVA
jgi:hypothetical protein